MIDGLRTGHVGINVSELERSTDFYCRVFGASAASSREDPDGILLALSPDMTTISRRAERQVSAPIV